MVGGQEITRTLVPEPASGLLLGGGVAAVLATGALTRVRRRKG